MDSKLTLNVDKTVISKAKKYAKSRGRSLSGLVEDYLKFLTASDQPPETEISPGIKSLMGSIRIPENADYKKDLAEQLSKKYREK